MLRLEEIIEREERIAQEFKLYDPEMPVLKFQHMSDKVLEIWKAKKKSVEEGTIYIGG